MRRGLTLAVVAFVAVGLAGCWGAPAPLTQGTLTFELPPACKNGTPLKLALKKQATLQVAIKNTAPPIGVGDASKQWPATFVTLDPGKNMRLDNMYMDLTQQNPPDQQVASHRYSFGAIAPGETKHLVAVMTAISPGSRTLTISAWGGHDYKVVPKHPPSASCTVSVG